MYPRPMAYVLPIVNVVRGGASKSNTVATKLSSGNKPPSISKPSSSSKQNGSKQNKTK